MRINKPKPRPKSFVALYPTGRELLPWLNEQEACVVAVEWVKKNRGRSLEWLWFNCPDWDWVYWLAEVILYKRDDLGGASAASKFQREVFPVPAAPAGADHVRKTLARFYPPTRPRN